MDNDSRDSDRLLEGSVPEPETIDEAHWVVHEIVALNCYIKDFWLDAHGWAPDSAAQLLSKSRLDWQVELSCTLSIWLEHKADPITDGRLILAWANLGALVEGTIKLFLSVYYEDYCRHAAEQKIPKTWDQKKSKVNDPDGLTLQPLIQFLEVKKVFKSETYDFIRLVQERRNAIHAYKHRPIGDATEFRSALVLYRNFLREVEGRLPTPHGWFRS